MEKETSGLISQNHRAVFTERSHKFSNVVDKLRNVKVGDQVAWLEFQPVLSYCVEEYPKNYEYLQSAVKEIFEIRRRAYFDQELRDGATANIRKVLSGVIEDKQDLLAAPMVCIRDLFEVNIASRRRRI